ncbi:conserved hypothetical protein [Burkholderia mallei PRL-20]|nr:hypothetical protein BMASAVP1_1673 [Burkholderia mallei SAVP1]EDK55834.1 hypothetical protein BMAFMH_E0989 [Burkholderia mallei FMH]EDK61767.1 hypothetical protein BMAJHU_I0906 [Burkholderia mallei JHU]EDP87428.1 hypothetical protein BMA10399_B1955 [Burkholderia mallei ATCC 10399]EEP84911.1 conserved hypothetical protein [Burkholderia mallei GB8 horse 4]EES46703.1 conserved hypothetical protein [Burkholderia mallei PRL-20]
MDDGEAEDGELADRRTGDIGSDIASARPALALTRVKR